MHAHDCPFCEPAQALMRNEQAVALEDKHPVSPGHILILPLRHEADYFALSPDEQAALWRLLAEVKIHLDAHYAPQGYNIGVNCGTSAGQTVMHAHLHLIPRYHGDMDDPRGGVRGVIPHRRIY